MGGKTAIVGGLVTGLITGAVVVGAVVLLAPSPAATVPAPTAAPIADPTPSPSASPEGSGAPSATPGASGSPGSASPGSASPGSASPASSAPASSASPGLASPASASPAASSDTGFGIGEPAPALAVPQLGGGDISLAALKGKPVWVNFMATWCPPCRDELPIMKALAARYADTGLVVLAIDVREEEAVADAFARELNVTFPVGLDTDGRAQAAWRALALPVHFWVDSDGIVRDGALGGIGPDIMARGLEAILPGVDVTP